MPSFYRPPMPRQLPLSPPEFIPSYNSNGCGGMHYQQNPYAAQHGVAGHEEPRYDFTERYGHNSGMAPPSIMYPQHGAYQNTNASGLQQPHYYDSVGASILPLPMPEMEMHRQIQQEQQRVDSHMKEEKPVGGVSAKLDYDMETMTDFVSEMAQGIIQPGRPSPPSFRKWVHQVLCATRLPSATILLSMNYLSIRMDMLSTGTPFKSSDSQVYRFLTTALMLGSKFLDDNTFINRSWSEVSGIPVTELNQLERDWLVALGYNLHREPTESRGFNSWLDHWKEYEARVAARAANTTKLAPINTRVQGNLNRLRSMPKLPSPVSNQSTYGKSLSSCESFSQQGTPGYTQFDPWHVSRSANERSPPHTPEYYGGPGTWAPPDGYARRSVFGFPPFHQLPSPQEQAPMFPQAYAHYGQHMWGGHGAGCNCLYCARQHPSYFMAPGFGPQSVTA
ncbi:cyclin-like protein [Diplodia corticola]|uniref:Cyclin-like protein n=1 Tax=Diplodia corticola TaxID=236234 RepID=A0A1J9S4E6_9PEZI|nr:cyclin-like protein [Diplodia corticola]OJD39827.1 cyclin-like protein [Diplodia corticola]